MSQYIVAQLEDHTIVEVWGPFPTQDSAADWLGRYDGRLLDFIWEQKGNDWFAVVEDGDIGLAYFQIRQIAAPEG